MKELRDDGIIGLVRLNNGRYYPAIPVGDDKQIFLLYSDDGSARYAASNYYFYHPAGLKDNPSKEAVADYMLPPDLEPIS